MPNTRVKAADSGAPLVLIARVECREMWMHKKLSEHMDDPQAFVQSMAGYNAADLRQIRALVRPGLPHGSD